MPSPPFRAEHFDEALANTSRALTSANQSSETYWRLRLLKAEIQLGKRDAPAALEALKFNLPTAYQAHGN